MLIKKSPLVLNDFLLLNSGCEFIEPSGDVKELNIISIMDSYPIDIDFGIKDDVEAFNIFVKIEINRCDTKHTGYSIVAEGVGLFCFNKEVTFSDDERRNFINVSALSICISNLRAIITNMTAYYPLGKYTLPSIDLGMLLKDKAEKAKK